MREDIERWVTKQLPAEWTVEAPEISFDGEEMLIELSIPDAGPGEGLARFREESREKRMEIADRIERRFGRKVSWGVRSGGERLIFSTASVPVMTRLRMPERGVLDTLIAGGVARTRSDALAWCVRLVGEHEDEWLQQLKDALVQVERVRSAGPRSRQEKTG